MSPWCGSHVICVGCSDHVRAGCCGKCRALRGIPPRTAAGTCATACRLRCGGLAPAPPARTVSRTALSPDDGTMPPRPACKRPVLSHRPVHRVVLLDIAFPLCAAFRLSGAGFFSYLYAEHLLRDIDHRLEEVRTHRLVVQLLFQFQNFLPESLYLL